MRVVKKVIAIGTLAVGVSLAGAGVAHAGTTLLGYNVTAPILGGPVNLDTQTKAITNHKGDVQTGLIGGDRYPNNLYNANAKQCKYTYGTGPSACGALVSNVYSYGYVYPPQTAAKGTTCTLVLSIQGANIFRVNLQGYWASN
ncbi:MAG TPA: hypothetical protein VHX87_11805 [Galbitalea sp.]|jgi:hypothetical protein|nr:hypothetical protein [Galbitalea sp.]